MNYKVILITIFIFHLRYVSAAKVIVRADFPVQVRLVLDDNEDIKEFISPGGNFTLDALLNGFSEIQWLNREVIYTAPLNIPGIQGTRNITIGDDNIVRVGAGTGIFEPAFTSRAKGRPLSSNSAPFDY